MMKHTGEENDIVPDRKQNHRHGALESTQFQSDSMWLYSHVVYCVSLCKKIMDIQLNASP